MCRLSSSATRASSDARDGVSGTVSDVCAAVGSGGADRASEEADQEQGKCQSGLDCPDRFTCSAGRCVPAPLQTASCGGFAAAGISLLGVGLVLRARRRG